MTKRKKYCTEFTRISSKLDTSGNSAPLPTHEIFNNKLQKIYSNDSAMYHMSQEKITTGLSAWITFKVVSESKYNFM